MGVLVIHCAVLEKLRVSPGASVKLPTAVRLSDHVHAFLSTLGSLPHFHRGTIFASLYRFPSSPATCSFLSHVTYRDFQAVASLHSMYRSCLWLLWQLSTSLIK